MYYYVYRIKCKHPESVEKYYYGYRSCTVDPKNDIYWSSSKYLKEAINKFGINYFQKKIVREFEDRNSALEFEMFLHEKFNVDKNPYFFNRAKSTKFGFNCDGSTIKGKTYEEIYGIEKAEKLKHQRSETFKKIDRNGSKNSFFGKTHKPELKEKWSLNRSGERAPKFGLRWITNGSTNKEIDPKNYVFEPGWYFGRISSRKGIPEKKLECIHCHKFVNGGNLIRWHNDNCKYK